MLAHFDRVVAVSFAFPQTVLAPLLSRGLELDTYGQFGFVTVALVWTRDLRIAGWPRQFGRDFFLCGYRIFVRMRDPSGRQLRGLKILRSETDKRSMVVLGNLTTKYRYHLVKVLTETVGPTTRLKTTRPEGRESLELTFAADGSAALPADSPFRDWREARRFAGPMPFTFSEHTDGTFVMVEGRRTNWTPQPVQIKGCRVAFFEREPFNQTNPILANAFMIENVEYRWERGQVLKPGIGR